jgi:hypothetical protein
MQLILLLNYKSSKLKFEISMRYVAILRQISNMLKLLKLHGLSPQAN